MRLLLTGVMLALLGSTTFGAPIWYDTKQGTGYALFDGERYLGWLDKSSAKFYPWLDSGKFGAPTLPPVSPPAELSQGPVNFGLDVVKLKSSPAYSINGKPCSKQEAFHAIGDSLVDDSALLRLTIVGPATMRQQVKNDLASHPALAQWKGKLLVQDYDPSNWTVRNRGLPTEGIILQDPTGKLLVSSSKYEGPELLDRLLKREPKGPSLPNLPQAPFGLSWPVIALIGIGAYLLLRKQS